jgi:hypothetical protein
MKQFLIIISVFFNYLNLSATENQEIIVKIELLDKNPKQEWTKYFEFSATALVSQPIGNDRVYYQGVNLETGKPNCKVEKKILVRDNLDNTILHCRINFTGFFGRLTLRTTEYGFSVLDLLPGLFYREGDEPTLHQFNIEDLELPYEFLEKVSHGTLRFTIF